MTPEEEKKNKRAGMIVSITTHAAILLIFALLMAWRAPNPPLPEYGIELNFGLDNAGTGDQQPETPVQESENTEEAKPEPEAEQEEIIEEPVEEQEVLEEIPEEVPVETPEQVETVEDLDSPDVVEEEQVEEKEPTPEVEEVVEEKVEEVTPQEEIIKEPEEEVGASGTEGEETTPEDANQGDKKDEEGDQGNPAGEPDDRALYGNPGGGGGASLSMSGWTWDSRPNPDDTTDESGRLVFEIKIDDEGYIISIRTLERTVNPQVEKIYRDEIEKLTFSKTDNRPAAPQSVGRITFIIKAK